MRYVLLRIWARGQIDHHVPDTQSLPQMRLYVRFGALPVVHSTTLQHIPERAVQP
jgi:hypothetical protein